jgi:hypothetical protein
VDFTSPAPQERRTVDFTWDGQALTARQPKQATVANLVLSADATDVGFILTSFKTFLVDVLEPDSYDYLIGRIEDPNDDLDFDSIDPMIRWLVEEFTGRPTQRPAASTRRPPSKRSGNPSTGRSRSPRASTPATSTPTAS